MCWIRSVARSKALGGVTFFQQIISFLPSRITLKYHSLIKLHAKTVARVEREEVGGRRMDYVDWQA